MDCGAMGPNCTPISTFSSIDLQTHRHSEETRWLWQIIVNVKHAVAEPVLCVFGRTGRCDLACYCFVDSYTKILLDSACTCGYSATERAATIDMFECWGRASVEKRLRKQSDDKASSFSSFSSSFED